jgi:putative ABC transport system permease protein
LNGVLSHDLRLAFRGLLKRPGFTCAALLTLAVGIGANATVFSIANAMLIRPLPFGEKSDRVVTLHSTHPTQAQDWNDSRLSYPDLQDLRAGSRTLEDAAGYVGRNFTFTEGGEAERVQGGSVTPNLFPMLGISPRLGRQFRPEEAQAPGFESVVLLGQGLWQRRFGGDPAIVGRAVRINGRALTVIGVMPERFKFPERDELWTPFRPAQEERGARYVATFGLLRPGATLAQAQAEADTIAKELAQRYPETNRRWGVQLVTFRDYAVSRQARLLTTLLLGAVGFVLLIGCANLANLLLARGTARQREMAVRTAIGATRVHLVRQMLAESLLLSVAGAAVGVALAAWALDVMIASFPEELPYWLRVEIDGRVLLFTAVLSLLTAIAFGLVPALGASRPDLTLDLKDGARGAAGSPRQRRLQGALVAGQVALCLALLVGANLLIRSFLEMQAADGGFDVERLVTLRVYLAGDAYDPVEAKAAFFRRAVEALRALPGVTAAAATTSIPTDDGGFAVRMVAEGQTTAPGEETGVSMIGTTPGLFETLGARLQEGRTFTESETETARSEVAIVNRGLAARFWPGQSAVGRRLGLVQPGGTRWLTIVGVAPEVHYEEFGEETAQSQLNVYVPYARLGWRTMGLLVRTEGSAAALVGSVRQAVRSLDASLPAYDVRTMSEVRAYTTWEQRFFGEMMGAFATSALFLACLGVYGVLAYTVGRRAREIGVRMALGARPTDVTRLVVGEGAVLAALGVAGGLLLSTGVARMLAGSLYGVSAADPWTFVEMAAFLGASVLLASWLPARRAARIDPMAALRQD